MTESWQLVEGDLEADLAGELELLGKSMGWPSIRRQPVLIHAVTEFKSYLLQSPVGAWLSPWKPIDVPKHLLVF